ncbi:unnamed protein product [Aureobasidium vineae]|uniref:Secreted protein n=1 Tax=Aureobasidium vineae TaxID=2773715 RepID=A0A9N8JLN0_9PEZI|nr:unnamed protein product [Aureobasidium vineae]
MHLFHALTTLLCCSSLAHAFVLEQRACVSSDVALVKQQVQHPNYFCTWFLSETRSPLPGLGPDALLGACKCVINAAPAGTWSTATDAIYKSARSQSFVPGGCPAAASDFIKNEFENVAAFCTFWQYA